jgi:hypothetical protein
MTCIGEPISWLRLEQLALGAAAPGVEEHVAKCGACRACLDSIRGDVVVLSPLVVPVRRAWRWWRLGVPALAFAGAMLILLLLWPRAAELDENQTAIKGTNDVLTLGIVRERAGAIRRDALSFRPGDRFKVIITCPPRVSAWIDVGVVEEGARSADYPMAPAAIACGNDVVVPGAFTLTGARANHVCVRVASGGAPPRSVPHPRDDGVACVTVRPE